MGCGNYTKRGFLEKVRRGKVVRSPASHGGVVHEVLRFLERNAATIDAIAEALQIPHHFSARVPQALACGGIAENDKFIPATTSASSSKPHSIHLNFFPLLFFELI